MRDLFFVILLLTILICTIRAVHAGILGWTWLTLMTPQKLAWGFFASSQPNLIVAVVTLIVWLFSPGSKRIPVNLVTVLFLVFMAFITFTTVFALAPDLAWPKWNLAIKAMVLGILVASIMTSRVRIHALVWIIALSLGYFGIKGGLFTLRTGGQFHVLAIEGSFGDNNVLAVALCMILPLMNYLRLQSANRFVRLGIIVVMGLTALGTLGTYSRGGLIGLTIMGAYLWWHSKSRIVIALVVLAVSVPAYNFMPAKWTARMSTIQTAEEDTSFRERLDAWRTAFNIAKARPLTGAGFDATLSPAVYRKFTDDATFVGGRAAHSIYFEVLGDHGFVGLGLYVAMLVMTWRYAGAARRTARRDPQLGWIADLAAMIQVSLISFVVAGAALSMAYYDMFYLLLGITVVLRKMLAQQRVQMQVALSNALPAALMRPT